MGVFRLIHYGFELKFTKSIFYGQEEIRFLICPEMIISCLICEKMQPDEAILIVGAERYSNYDGYDRTFRWLHRPRFMAQDLPRFNWFLFMDTQ